jgi:hypothetical protein
MLAHKDYKNASLVTKFFNKKIIQNILGHALLWKLRVQIVKRNFLEKIMIYIIKKIITTIIISNVCKIKLIYRKMKMKY